MKWELPAKTFSGIDDLEVELEYAGAMVRRTPGMLSDELLETMCFRQQVKTLFGCIWSVPLVGRLWGQIRFYRISKGLRQFLCNWPVPGVVVGS